MKNQPQKSESTVSCLIANLALRLRDVHRSSLVALGIASVLLLPTGARADEDGAYYIYHGQERNLSLDAAAVAVKLSESSASMLIKSRRISPSLAAAGFASANVMMNSLPGWFILDAKHAKTVQASANRTQAAAAAQIHEVIRSVLNSNDSSVEFVSPVFRDEQGGPIIITSRILVGFQKDFSSQDRERLRAAIPEGAEVETVELPQPNEERWLIHSRDGFHVLARANVLAGMIGVTYAEPDLIATGYTDLIPNDPNFSQSWGLQNTGQSGGLPGFDMAAPSAWDITTGSSSVKVLVMDSGVQQNHPDINQITGKDFTTDAPSNPNGEPFGPNDNHGTAVAGCISERINNFLGTAGISPSVNVVSARCYNNYQPNGSFSFQFSWVVDALNWGLSTGVQVTNNSNKYGSTSSAIESAYSSTRANGMVHFASAGNDASASIGYPSSIPSVNSVGAVNRFGNRATFSNYGTGLKFMGPGENIYTTDRTGSNGYVSGDYVTVDGTSFASPYTAGVAALIISRNPNFLPDEIENRMAVTCTDMGPSGYDTGYGYGLVNAYRALSAGGGGGQELLTNGGFELGYTDWSVSGSSQILQGSYPHMGTWYAFLGNSNNSFGILAHNYFAIPSSATAATFSFWLNIVTQETTVGPYDTLIVNLVDGGGNAHRLATYSEADSGSNINGDYGRRSFDVSVYRGQSVQIQFVGTTDVSLPTIFRIDDVSLRAGSIAPKPDFNGDGNADILWQNNATGQRFIWLMAGTGHVGGVGLETVGTDWQIAGTDDFNGDGQTDILWENSNTGQRFIWLISGTGHIGGVGLETVGTEWKIAGTGDFSGDGQVDILWENSITGQRFIWFMNGTQHIGGVGLGTVGTEWKIAGTDDFNGDGQVDILWQNSNTGQRFIWLMAGTQHIGGADLGIVATSWDIRNH